MGRATVTPISQTYPFEELALLPVTSLIADEWPMLCSERVVWSSRKADILADECNGGMGHEAPVSRMWEEMYRRLWVKHIDVIPACFRNNCLDVDMWEPLVDLIDTGGVHHLSFGEWALASVVVLCRLSNFPNNENPVEVQPYYAVGNTLRQHVAFRAVQRANSNAQRIQDAKSQQFD